MQFKQMFVTAVCVLFLLKLKWPKSKNFHETIHERYGHDTLKTVRRYERDLSRYNKVALDITDFPSEMQTIASRDQFKPIRIGENLLVNYNQ